MKCSVCHCKNINEGCCQRCKCDLTLLMTLDVQAGHYLRQAIHAIAHERFTAAMHDLQQAKQLHCTPLTLKLQQFVQELL